MNRRTLKIGIMPRPQFQTYTIAIAKGEYQSRPDEPKIWFESLHALAQVLSEKNQALLGVIVQNQPHSFQDLADLTGQNRRSLSKTLNTLARYGIVELVKSQNKVCPVVKITDFQVELGLPVFHS
jgi:predicted transcriptional regulator